MKIKQQLNLFKVYNFTPNKRNFKNIFKLLLFFTVLCLLLIFSKTNFESVKNSTNIFLSNILPSLFPFILFTEIILSSNIIDMLSNIFGFITKNIFKINKNCTPAIIIGFLCGYPMGAKTITHLYNENKISREDANKLITFTNNCNPVFILSTIGISIFSNLYIGIILLSSHYISSICTFFFVTHTSIIHENLSLEKTFFKNDTTNSSKKSTELTFFEIIKTSILKSFITLGIIFGFIVLFNLGFSIINEFLTKLNISQNTISFLSGIFEVTKGSLSVYSLNLPIDLKIIAISFLLGFSGLCIIFQVYSVLQENKFRFKILFFSKLVQGIISAFFTFIMLKILNIQYVNLAVYNNISNTITYDEFIHNIIHSYTNSIFLIILGLCIFNIVYILRHKEK